MKSENLNFLEPSGPLLACNWTALPFLQFSPLYGNFTAHLQIFFAKYIQFNYNFSPYNNRMKMSEFVLCGRLPKIE
jgi:hypothetical protein